MRIALIEVSHWHFPLYVPALKQPGIEIVGLTDTEGVAGERVAAEFACPLFPDLESLLELDGIDFAFGFGRHAEMPRIGQRLVKRQIPFALEKPCGVDADAVGALRRQAEARNLFVAVPFIFRQSDLLAELRALEGDTAGAFSHLAFRFIAGPPERYLEAGLPWMLDPEISGGGSAINLSGHFIDLCRLLTLSEVRSVHARMSRRLHDRPIEDYAVLTLEMASGATGLVETGYAFPMTGTEQREFTFSLSSTSHYVRSAPGGIVTIARPGTEGALARSIRLDTDGYYALFVERTLADFRSGAAPLAGLAEAEAALRVIDAAYVSARSGEVVRLE